MSDRSTTFRILIDEVQACVRCPRMRDSARLLGHSVGNLNAPVMFVGEAPGRLGADQTHIPFHGDASGHNFEDLIAFAGLIREEIYVTNAVLCNPRDDRGNNATPNLQEIANCSGFLRRQIELVRPKMVVTLGATALRALGAIEPHGLSLNENVRTANDWFGRVLIPLYHPGQRAMVHRSYANQRSDYQFVAEHLRKIGSAGSRTKSGAVRGEVLQACRYVLEKRGELSYFELHKLAYLAEYVHVKRTGRRLTKAFFIRQKEGPYCVDLNLQRLKRSKLPLTVTSRAGKLLLRLETNPSADLFGAPEVGVSDEMRETLEEVLARYDYPNDAELKRAVYLTAPMRSMLRREQLEGANLYNAPIDFLNIG